MKPHRIYKKVSSRYSGPADSSRPAKDIFDGIEARSRENEIISSALRSALDIALMSREYASFEDRVALIKRICINWLYENDPELEAKLEKAGEK